MQKTYSCPLLGCQKSQSLSRRQSSLNSETTHFCWFRYLRLAKFVEVPGVWRHLYITEVENCSPWREVVFENTRLCISGFTSAIQVSNPKPIHTKKRTKFMRGRVRSKKWSQVVWFKIGNDYHPFLGNLILGRDRPSKQFLTKPLAGSQFTNSFSLAQKIWPI